MEFTTNKIKYLAIFLLSIGMSMLAIAALNTPSAEIKLATNASGESQLPDSSVYKGQYKNGLFHGTGTLTWGNGNSYRGQFENGLMHGTGVLTLATGDVYKGSMVKGLMQGKGNYKFKTGDEYTGDFYKGYFEGQGIYIFFKGSEFEGGFSVGEADGLGKIRYKNGNSYQGEIKSWRMHGRGELHTVNGNTYSGVFVDSNMSGKGEIKFKSADRYNGDIKNWIADGTGEIFFNNGNHYSGELKQGFFHGHGVLTYKNGNRYEGKFEKGSRQGKGTLILADPKGHKKQQTGWWLYDRYMGKNKPKKPTKNNKPKPINAEEIFYQQHALLSKSLSSLKTNSPSVPDMYMIAFGSSGYQDVFMNEVKFSKHYFDVKLGTKDRSIELINNHKVTRNVPLASVSNLGTALQYVSELMDKQQDILFLFLTSHGSKEHELTVSLRGLPLNNLSAKKLALLLQKTAIKWKVIVVSACYSGGFINELKDEFTMIITAAKADHVSFGCSEKATYTYFGQAFFKQAIPNTKTFIQAFSRAKQLIIKMENKENFSHSEPQIHTSPKIEAQLKMWRKSLKK